ncbi:hypothetical protein K2X33_10155 [bacterium]|nr:hypothetical protein [bacterium]
MKRVGWLVLLSMSVGLVGCGNNAGIIFDSSVPAQQQALLENDINRLAQMKFPSATANDAALLGIANMDGAALTKWIGERIRVIIGEDFNVSGNTYTFSNPTPFTPVLFSELSPVSAADGELSTIMVNIGADLYLKARASNKSYFLDMGIGFTQVYTPRVGIIQIGEGLFTVQGYRTDPIDSVGNTLARVSTLIHESRHSDGNGVAVAFPHASCPSWMGGGFANQPACEGYLNGPYSIQTAMMKVFRNSCVGCSQSELYGMDKSISDYASRLQSGATFQDIRPEALAELQ